MPTIPVYNKCNNNCLICTNPDDFFKESDSFDLKKLIKRIYNFSINKNEFLENYSDSFTITGGEPTLYREIRAIISKIHSFYPKKQIILLTNGRMFSYKDYAKAILQLCPDLEIVISLHGHNSRIHDKITQVRGSFIQTMKGIENVLKFKNYKQVMEMRIVLHKINYKFFKFITLFLKNHLPVNVRIVFMFFEVEGQSLKNLNKLRLTYTELRPFLENIKNFFDFFSDIRLYHFPLCVLPIHLSPYIWRTLPFREVSFLKSCYLCKLKGCCLGVHRGYLKYIGTHEFKPIKDKINFIKDKNWHHPIQGLKS